jgi:hypothetical protein
VTDYFEALLRRHTGTSREVDIRLASLYGGGGPADDAVAWQSSLPGEPIRDRSSFSGAAPTPPPTSELDLPYTPAASARNNAAGSEFAPVPLIRPQTSASTPVVVPAILATPPPSAPQAGANPLAMAQPPLRAPGNSALSGHSIGSPAAVPAIGMPIAAPSVRLMADTSVTKGQQSVGSQANPTPLSTVAIPLVQPEPHFHATPPGPGTTPSVSAAAASPQIVSSNAESVTGDAMPDPGSLPVLPVPGPLRLRGSVADLAPHNASGSLVDHGPKRALGGAVRSPLALVAWHALRRIARSVVPGMSSPAVVQPTRRSHPGPVPAGPSRGAGIPSTPKAGPPSKPTVPAELPVTESSHPVGPPASGLGRVTDPSGARQRPADRAHATAATTASPSIASTAGLIQQHLPADDLMPSSIVSVAGSTPEHSRVDGLMPARSASCETDPSGQEREGVVNRSAAFSRGQAGQLPPTVGAAAGESNAPDAGLGRSNTTPFVGPSPANPPTKPLRPDPEVTAPAPVLRHLSPERAESRNGLFVSAEDPMIAPRQVPTQTAEFASAGAPSLEPPVTPPTLPLSASPAKLPGDVPGAVAENPGEVVPPPVLSVEITAASTIPSPQHLAAVQGMGVADPSHRAFARAAGPATQPGVVAKPFTSSPWGEREPTPSGPLKPATGNEAAPSRSVGSSPPVATTVQAPGAIAAGPDSNQVRSAIPPASPPARPPVDHIPIPAAQAEEPARAGTSSVTPVGPATSARAPRPAGSHHSWAGPTSSPQAVASVDEEVLVSIHRLELRAELPARSARSTPPARHIGLDEYTGRRSRSGPP